jgi:hypothetical protein
MVSASAMDRPPSSWTAAWMCAPRPGEEQKQIRPRVSYPALEADAVLNTHRRPACCNGSARAHLRRSGSPRLVLDVPEGP